MAKIKKQLDWVALNIDSFPKTVQVKHQAIRDAFAQLKVLKDDFETDVTKLLHANAKKLPADVVDRLRIVDVHAKRAVLKYSYMRGVACAADDAPKAGGSKAGGIAIA